jgi:CDP-6-deoxy-D-xylo-4-hexulose-3-dehydrase
MELLTFLENQNIQTRVCFAGNVTRHPIYRDYFQPFPNSDIIMGNAFLLGSHHGLNIDDIDYVCDKIKEFFELKHQSVLHGKKITPGGFKFKFKNND